MSASAMKGSLQRPCFMAAYLSGHNPQNNNFCDRHAPRSRAVPSMSWSMDNDKRHRKLKAQAPEWILPNNDYLFDGQAFQSDTDLPAAIHIDLLNRKRFCSPLLERTKLVITDQHKRRLKAHEQRYRDLVDGLVEYISSDIENYKYVIIASKLNANMIMEEGFISSYARDEILDGLERIEKDIEEGKFVWRNNKDMRTNIVEALIDIVGGPAKRLDAIISHYVQMLTVLQIWCHDSIDKFVAQIKELQVELVLLAIRNEGLVLPCTWRRANCILLGDLVLSKLEQLERDVSRLVSCKNKMDFTLLTAFPSGSTDGSINSLSKGGLHHIHDYIMDFGNMIVSEIAHDLSNLELDLDSWMSFHLLTPNDEVTKSVSLMWKHMVALDIFEVMPSSCSIYNAVEDSSKRFLTVYKIVPEMLKTAKEFAKNSSFNHEKVQSFPPIGFVGAPWLAGFRTSKDLDQGAGAAEKQNFKFHSDDTTGKLLNWLRRLQSGQKK